MSGMVICGYVQEDGSAKPSALEPPKPQEFRGSILRYHKAPDSDASENATAQDRRQSEGKRLSGSSSHL